jgi:hypothetical protein
MPPKSRVMEQDEVVLPKSPEKLTIAEQEARRRYVRRYTWRIGPAFVLAMTGLQLLLDDHPFGHNAIKRFIFVTTFALVVGLPYYAYRLGRTWDRLHRRM